MKQENISEDYNVLIKKIKRKKRIVKIITVIAFFAVLFLTAPGGEVKVNDKVVAASAFETPVVCILLLIVIFICSTFMTAMVISPLNTSMDIECDPVKHMTLNIALGNKKAIDSIYAVDYFYLGKFNIALEHAVKMTESKNSAYGSIGFFNKARCEFFIGDTNALRNSVAQYKTATADIKNKKAKAECDKIQTVLDFMTALADKDIDKIKILYNNVDVWNTSQATLGFVNYLKGLAAYYMGENKDCVYYLMCVKNNCEKTVFASLAEEILLKTE